MSCWDYLFDIEFQADHEVSSISSRSDIMTVSTRKKNKRLIPDNDNEGESSSPRHKRTAPVDVAEHGTNPSLPSISSANSIPSVSVDTDEGGDPFDVSSPNKSGDDDIRAASSAPSSSDESDDSSSDGSSSSSGQVQIVNFIPALQKMPSRPLKKDLLCGEVNRPKGKNPCFKSAWKKGNRRIRELESYATDSYDKFDLIYRDATNIISNLKKKSETNDKVF